MLNNATDFKSQILTGKIVTGTVIDNNDPLHLGRIKVRVNELHPQSLEDQYLPWVESWQFISNTQGQGNIHIPDIGTDCRVLYPSDDVYSGVYISSLPNVTQELLEDYPNSYGMIDRSGNLFLVNTQKDTFTYYHVSGTNLKIDGAGRTKIQITNAAPENPTALVENPMSLDIEVTGDCNLKVSQNINYECKNFNIKASEGINLESNYYSLNSNSMINMNTNSSFNVGAGTALTMSTKGVATVIGSSGNFGGSGSSIDGHLIQPYQTDVAHIPFLALNPIGIPPTPTVATVTQPILQPVNTPAMRQRQAYQEPQQNENN